METNLSIFSDNFLFERLDYMTDRFKDLPVSGAEFMALNQDKVLITEELIKRGYKLSYPYN